ncbi:MAG: hypothetical protein QOI71_3178, partial [Gaiellales bacterium]|nr:hypothetical protein [Gaiellales bacterium]
MTDEREIPPEGRPVRPGEPLPPE